MFHVYNTESDQYFYRGYPTKQFRYDKGYKTRASAQQAINRLHKTAPEWQLTGLKIVEKNPKSRGQHWIATVTQIANRRVDQQAYFDGSMTGAKKYFKKLPVINKYWGKPGYTIVMQPNAIVLWDGYESNPKRRKKNPEHEIRELILFSENSPSLHNQYVSIMKNLSRKKKRGVYDPVLAAKLWKYWIDEGVKQYNKEILGGGHSLKQNVFTMADRKQAAIEMEDQEQEEVFSLEYLKNPKRRKTMRKKKRSAKQLANDRRLGRMAKARAKKKRGGRRKKNTHKKTWRRSTPKKVARRRANPKAKRKTTAGRWYQIFKCKGASVHFLALTTAGKIRWTLTRGDTVRWSSKSEATKIARRIAKSRKLSGFYIGVAGSNTSASAIVTECKGGK